MKPDKTVYIVHSVDSEGPLDESLEATFERLKDLYGIQLEPSAKTLKQIQRQEMDFGPHLSHLAADIARVFSPHMLNYNRSLKDINHMLERILDKTFRNQLIDSFGNGWVYNWFCVDHVDYLSNPRKRELGYHKIFDFYRERLKYYEADQDGLHWHFHPMSTYREAHRSATSFVNSPHLYQVLCRRIIERNYFPTAIRAGFQAERPDSHLFFEQWIPFDFSNWAYHGDSLLENQNDLKGGRSGDWRLAPSDWSCYQPSHDHWQLPGNCRRWISRSLDFVMRGREFPLSEVEKAFARASSGKPTLMGCTNHDFRDIGYEVDLLREKISSVSKKFPDVKFKFCEAVEGFRSVVYGPNAQCKPLQLKITLTKEEKGYFLEVKTLQGRVFGPQPFLAVQTKSNRFIHDNFDFDPSLSQWSYTFDQDSIRADDVHAIGVGANDTYGHTFVNVLKL